MESLFVVKTGGAALTNKNGFCEPNDAAIERLTDEVVQLWPLVSGRLVLVVGGGSFGNAIPQKYALVSPALPAVKHNLFRMTAGMFGWASTVCEALCRREVPAYPLQLGALVTGCRGNHKTDGWTALSCALRHGLLPVLTGDLVLSTETDEFEILSSDAVPELLAQWFPLERVVFQSNVRGLYLDRNDPGSLIRRVDRANIAAAIHAAGPSGAADITGGMHAKVNAIERLTCLGIRVVLCSAESGRLHPALFSQEPPGTLFVPASEHAMTATARSVLN